MFPDMMPESTQDDEMEPESSTTRTTQANSQPQPTEAENQFVVKGASCIDVDAYCSLYKGNILLKRLKFIIDHSEDMVHETLTIALSAVKTTFNIDTYRQLHETMRKKMPEQCPSLDESWISMTLNQIGSINDRLENDIKQYKNSAIKESIKRGYEELAEHKLKQGDVAGALKCYSQSRDYCLQPTHIRNMCLNVITTSALLGNYAHVMSYASKMSTEKTKETMDPATKGKILCATALSDIFNKKYAFAASKFLLIDFDSFKYSELVSAHNIGLYGAITALATKPRKELKEQVLQGSTFKQFLELEPNMREAIIAFVDSKYSDALKFLEIQRNLLRLDFFMSPHVSYLYEEIRKKCLVQYLQPYKNALISKMAVSFNSSEDELMEEVSLLIISGRLSAKIDFCQGLIVQQPPNHKEEALKNALAAQKEFIRCSRSFLLRNTVNSVGLSIGCSNPKAVQKADIDDEVESMSEIFTN